MAAAVRWQEWRSKVTVNPALRRLGFSDEDRVVVLHADDIGMCQATLPAYQSVLDFGVLSSAATMTPCPWFSGLGRFCRERAGDPRVDMGVHLTMNCEWTDYRWPPVSKHDRSSGLTRKDGGMHYLAVDVAGSVDLRAMEGELRAQVDRAYDAGIDVTHVDTHMLTLWHPRLLESYFRVAFEFRLPLFMLRRVEDMIDSAILDASALDDLQATIDEAESDGMVFFDRIRVLPLEYAANRIAAGKEALAAAQPGTLTNILIHPAVDTPELRSIAPDYACRVADHALFTSEAWRDAVHESGVKVIGFRQLRDLVRQKEVGRAGPA